MYNSGSGSDAAKGVAFRRRRNATAAAAVTPFDVVAGWLLPQQLVALRRSPGTDGWLAFGAPPGGRSFISFISDPLLQKRLKCVLHSNYKVLVDLPT